MIRHAAALAVGIGVAALAVAAAGIGLLFGAVLGLILCAVVWVALAPEGAFDPRRRRAKAAAMPERVRAELDQAAARVKSLRRLAYARGLEPLRESLLAISESTTAMVADVERQPADYPRLRKALTHYLGHAETIAERLHYIAGAGGAGAESAAVERSQAILQDLADVYRQYRERMLDDEVLDVDARLTLLEGEIGAQTAQAAGGREDRRPQ